MKKTLIVFISILAISLVGFGQVKPIQKAVIATPGVQDEACKTRIENQLAHEYGVKAVKVDFRKHVVGVQWYTDRTNIENIKTAIANMGYDADDVTAEPDACKRLSKACQHVSK